MTEESINHDDTHLYTLRTSMSPILINSNDEVEGSGGSDTEGLID